MIQWCESGPETWPIEISDPNPSTIEIISSEEAFVQTPSCEGSSSSSSTVECNGDVIRIYETPSPCIDITVPPLTPTSEGWSNFTQGTPKLVEVTAISTVLLLANPARKFARLANNTTQTIYLQYQADAVWKRGFPLAPNAQYVINTTELFLGQINAITLTGSAFIDVIEGVV